MNDINLLPSEFKPKKYAVRLGKLFKKILSIFSIFFFAAFLLYVFVRLYLAYEIRQSVSREKGLVTEVGALSQTEHRLILVKDRLDKIKQIVSGDELATGVVILETLVESGLSDYSVKELVLKPDSLSVKITAQRSFELTNFEDLLSGLGFREVKLLSMEFSEEFGYEALFLIK